MLRALPRPRFPEAARRMRRGARRVPLRLLIGADGTVERIESLGVKAELGFDNAARKAVRRSTWQAGTVDGEPTPMWTELSVDVAP